MIDIRSKYHVALNDIGYVLQNAPESPSYVLSQATLFNNRLAQGDRTYDDFAQWWYWAQTDWWQGIKDDTAWADDGKYYYSTNIDTWSEIGAIKLSPIPVLNATITENIICGHEGYVNSSIKKYLGTDDNTTSSKPIVYQWDGDSWEDISSAQITTNQNVIAQISTRLNYLWVSTVGVGTTNVILHYSGSAWDDVGANIASVLTGTWQPASSRCHVTIGSKIYIFVDNSINNEWACVSATLAAPTADADFTKVIEYLSDDGLPIDACEYEGNLYYLVNYSYNIDLRMYDIANATDTLIRRFNGATAQNWGMGGKLLKNYNGKLVITIPFKEIWEWDGSTLTRIYRQNTDKNTISNELIAYLYYGAVQSDNKLWWGNMVYDGFRFYNTWKDITDDATKNVQPMFTDLQDYIWQTDTSNTKKIYSVSLSAFKGTADKNYLVFNNNDKISGVDKIAFSLTLLFKKFSSGQSIVVEYNTGEFTSISTGWTALGTASYTLDGASATQKILYFPNNTTYKKIWFRVKLNGDGTNTPALKDFVLAYLPTPFLDKEWSVNLDCGNEIRLLNGSLETRKGRELKGKLEAAWLTRQILDFQDVDYASTAINKVGGITAAATTIEADDTSEFPEVGRLRIEDEIIYYTGKTQVSFTGCSRGQKGTIAATHADNTVIHNGFKVMIQNFRASVPILNDGKKLEYVVAVNLREII